MRAGVKEANQHHAENASVRGHSALVDFQSPPVRKVTVETREQLGRIKQTIAKPPADENANRRVRHEVGDLDFLKESAAATGEPENGVVAGDKSRQVGQAVPAY